MSRPCTPFNEKIRLEEVKKLNVLDSHREVFFENITRLIQNIFKVDIVGISIIDQDRQWFKSIRGIDLKETPRELSFCSDVICDTNLMVIEDALKNERFKDHPLVVHDPKIRFYAGCPLFTNNDYGIGSLCLINKKPRKFTNEEREILKGFGKIIEDHLNHYQLKSKNPAINNSLNKLKLNFNHYENSHILSKNDFINYFNYLQSFYTDLERYHKLPYERFCLLVLEIKNLSYIKNNLDLDNQNKLQESIIDQIIKNLNSDDIIAKISDNQFLVLINDISELRVQTIIENISFCIANIDTRPYGLTEPIKTQVGYTVYNTKHKYPVARLIDLACQKIN